MDDVMNQNEPAFPTSVPGQWPFPAEHKIGMTKLELAATHIMAGLAANKAVNLDDQDMARAATFMAKCLLKETGKENDND